MVSRRTVHFVYSLPCGILNKVTIRLWKKLLFHHSFSYMKWPSPIKAPLSITYHAAQFFLKNYEVKLYDFRERIDIKPNNGDILIGHPNPDPKSVMWRALDDPRFAKKFLLCPYNHCSSQVVWFRPAVEKCDKYFAICGDFWIDNFKGSPFADLSHKIVHVNMALNASDYPYLKKRFNPVKQRRFFYIGRASRFGDEKGITLLERLSANIPGFAGGYICEGGDIAGWSKVSDPTILTPEFIAHLASSYDFFINMSRADAQATTVLEAMSWGFPVACTSETGYLDRNLFLLDLEDLSQNIAVIERMQNLSEKQLQEISLNNRRVVETKYSWKQFVKVLEDNIE